MGTKKLDQKVHDNELKYAKEYERNEEIEKNITEIARKMLKKNMKQEDIIENISKHTHL